MAFEPSPYEPLDDRTQRRGVVLAGVLGLVELRVRLTCVTL